MLRKINYFKIKKCLSYVCLLVGLFFLLVACLFFEEVWTFHHHLCFSYCFEYFLIASSYIPISSKIESHSLQICAKYATFDPISHQLILSWRFQLQIGFVESGIGTVAWYSSGSCCDEWVIEKKNQIVLISSFIAIVLKCNTIGILACFSKNCIAEHLKTVFTYLPHYLVHKITPS